MDQEKKEGEKKHRRRGRHETEGLSTEPGSEIPGHCSVLAQKLVCTGYRPIVKKKKKKSFMFQNC